MLELDGHDLATDPLARRFVKEETVDVTFAPADGELVSLEGPNRYEAGDAIVTGETGTRWSVSRDRFDARYDAVPPAVPGEDGRYRARPLPVLARQIDQAFRARRRAGGDWLQGAAGDWLLQYGPGDFGVAAQKRFRRIYRPVTDESPD